MGDVEVMVPPTPTPPERGARKDPVVDDGETTRVGNTKKKKEESTPVPAGRPGRRLGTRSVGMRGYARRATVHRPTLDEFESISFADYVRFTIMGIDLDSDSDSDSDDSSVSNSEPGKEGNDEAGDGGGGDEEEVAAAPKPADDDEEEEREGARGGVDGEGGGAGGGGAGGGVGGDELFICREVLPDLNKLKNDGTPTPTLTSPTSSAPPSSAPPKTVTTSSTLVFDLEEAEGGPPLNDEDDDVNSSSSEDDDDDDDEDSLSLGEPCPRLQGDGIAKVVPPDGWWDGEGIGRDTSGRGPLWQEGSKLGDMKIETPIKQCLSGIGGIYQYTLFELKSMPVHEFRSKADEYRKRQVGSALITDEQAYDDDFMDELATRKFWRRLGPTMEPAMYGADMEGSLFGGDDVDACGWNLDRLESCLALLRADAPDGHREDVEFKLPGVTSSYLYFGMWASVFAAHTEDMNLLSINYLHAGAPKYWYAISAEDSPRFESLAASHYGTENSACPEFLRHKRCLLSPAILRKAGISFTTQVQRPGEFVVTFPGSYHFGFNTGFNVAEATNFAVPEWFPRGKRAGICLCHPHSVRIDMDRFGVLLRKYERHRRRRKKKGSEKRTDSIGSGAEGERRVLSYSEWAREEATRRWRRRARPEAADAEGGGNGEGDGGCVDDAHDGDAAGGGPDRSSSLHSRGRSTGPPSTVGGTPVRVVASTRSRAATRGANRGGASSKKKGASSSHSGKRGDRRSPPSVGECRIAINAKPSKFIPGAEVLCVLSCEDGDGGQHEKKKRFFPGTVKEVTEGHAKIHFSGGKRKEDMWMPLDSTNLFLDGGVEDVTEGTRPKRQRKVRR